MDPYIFICNVTASFLCKARLTCPRCPFCACTSACTTVKRHCEPRELACLRRTILKALSKGSRMPFGSSWQIKETAQRLGHKKKGSAPVAQLLSSSSRLRCSVYAGSFRRHVEAPVTIITASFFTDLQSAPSMFYKSGVLSHSSPSKGKCCFFCTERFRFSLP